MCRMSATFVLAVLTSFALTVFQTQASAQTFSVIHNFTGGQDGGGPGAVTVDGAGNVVGSTNVGGAHGHGLFSGCREEGPTGY